MLVLRGLVEVVSTGTGKYKRELWLDSGEVTVDVPYEYNIYKLVHTPQWYKEILIEAIAQKLA